MHPSSRSALISTNFSGACPVLSPAPPLILLCIVPPVTMFSRRSKDSHGDGLLQPPSPTGKKKHNIVNRLLGSLSAASTTTYALLISLAAAIVVIFYLLSNPSSPNGAFLYGAGGLASASATGEAADVIDTHLRAIANVKAGESRLTQLVPSPLDSSQQVHPDVALLLKEAVSGLQPIPANVHFVIGTQHGHTDEPDTLSPPPPFLLQHWLAIKSAHDILTSPVIFCHVASEPPASEWWDRAKPLCSHVLPARPLKHIFGRPVLHAQHKSDILRLEALLMYGGLAVDLDVIVMKDWLAAEYRAQWLNVDMMLGYAQSEGKNWADKVDVGVIAARQGSWFLKEWYNAYRMFDSRPQLMSHGADIAVYKDDVYAFASSLAYRMALTRPHLITLAPAEQYGRPWGGEGEGGDKIYRDKEWGVDEMCALHLWQGEQEKRRESAGKVEVELDEGARTAFSVTSVEEACGLAGKSLYGIVLKRALLAGKNNEFKC